MLKTRQGKETLEFPLIIDEFRIAVYVERCGTEALHGYE